MHIKHTHTQEERQYESREKTLWNKTHLISNLQPNARWMCRALGKLN